MSLVKLISSPMRIFQKHVINFLIVRRHDLGYTEDQIRYIAVKPTASKKSLRHKIWCLLDLPDYCDEIIILKTSENVEVPLTALRKGNQPNRPYFLEVWRSVEMTSMTTIHKHMLTMGRDEDEVTVQTSECSCGNANTNANSTVVGTESNATVLVHQTRIADNSRVNSFTSADFKKLDLSSRISNSSFIIKLQGKKSKDNFANVLLKLQSDLSELSKKLSTIENRIPS